jgi:DNA polymerase-3 subunit delta
MIISNATADDFVRQLPSEISFFLVHGPDDGLAHERVKAIVRKLTGGDSDPMRLVRFDGDTLARTPGALADEAYATSMFGGARAIWIDAQSRDLLPSLEPLLKRPPIDCRIVVKAGPIKKGMGLKAAFERSPICASIECYPDSPKALESLVDAELREAELAITSDARAALVALLGSDRGVTRGEITKLMLYARGKSEITAADVEAIVSDAAPSNLDQVIDHALMGDRVSGDDSANRFFGEGGDADYLMTRLAARLMLIYRLRIEMDQVRSFEAACQALFVKGPPSAQRALAQEVADWTSDALENQLPAIRKSSERVRTAGGMAEIVASRSLWAIASQSRRRKAEG